MSGFSVASVASVATFCVQVDLVILHLEKQSRKSILRHSNSTGLRAHRLWRVAFRRRSRPCCIEACAVAAYPD
eukprot:3669665-Rhodomonas_salina.1